MQECSSCSHWLEDGNQTVVQMKGYRRVYHMTTEYKDTFYLLTSAVSDSKLEKRTRESSYENEKKKKNRKEVKP